jgi:hypothetical protein
MKNLILPLRKEMGLNSSIMLASSSFLGRRKITPKFNLKRGKSPS